MTFKTSPAPHIHSGDRSSAKCLDVLIALVPLCAFSAIYYGFRSVIMVLTGMLSAIIFELLAFLIMKKKPQLLDYSAAVTGGIIGALMSPMAPYWMPVTGAAFAILVVKIPMGGNGHNLFNPAAAGIAFLTLCFPENMFTYPVHHNATPLPVFGSTESVFTAQSPGALLSTGGHPTYSPTTLLIGNFTGPIGATAIIILFAAMLYLLVRRSLSLYITLPYLAVCAIIALMFPRTTGGLDSVALELCSGYLLFCGIFMLNDPVTIPKYWLSKIAFGLLAGILVMSLRHFGRFEEGACFAVLIANSFAPLIDRGGWRLINLSRYMKQRNGD